MAKEQNVTVETSTGFKCKISAETLDDMRLIELIAEMQEDATVLPKFLSLFLGEEQKAKLYQHVATKDGRVPLEPLQNEIAEIMEQYGGTSDGKK